MKKYLLFIVLPFLGSTLFGQIPQIAVVRPDGTTFICPTLDSAYNKAIDGDHIYLPGGVFSLSSSIKKKISIFGAGHNPDSTSATGITYLGGEILISQGASGGSLIGAYIASNVRIDDETHDFFLSRCNFYELIFNSTTPVGNVISENVIRYGIYGHYSSGNIISNNIVNQHVKAFVGSTQFKNNVFLGMVGSTLEPVSSAIFENNVFVNGSSCNDCVFRNNIINGIVECNGVGCLFTNNIFNTNVVFSNPSIAQFGYSENFHLLQNSPGKNGGTDGTDIGIYGGTFQWNEGSVPPNPHIYYKKVGTQTSSDGKLRVQMRVRTNS